MRIAYLITAYKDPAHLKRLINSLNIKDSHFFIHIDKKINIAPYLEIIEDKNVTFIDKRFYICWGGWSQVESIVALIEKAVNFDHNFDRVVVISGQDYPIFSNKEIVDLFTKNTDKEYLIGYNVTNGNSKAQLNKVRRYHNLDIHNKNIKRIINRLMHLCPFKKKAQVYFNDRYNDVYFGSDYWALTYECARYVYKTFTEQKSLQEYLKTSFVPSEIFVHTIVFNSKYADEAEKYIPKDYEGLYLLTPLHHIEYGKQIKVFDETDYEKLINTGKMFFRKAETKTSDLLLDKIDLLRKNDEY